LADVCVALNSIG